MIAGLLANQQRIYAGEQRSKAGDARIRAEIKLHHASGDREPLIRGLVELGYRIAPFLDLELRLDGVQEIVLPVGPESDYVITVSPKGNDMNARRITIQSFSESEELHLSEHVGASGIIVIADGTYVLELRFYITLNEVYDESKPCEFETYIAVKGRN